MVVMGDADELVDVDVSRRGVAKYRGAGMSYEYVEVPGGSHSSADRRNIDKVLGLVDKYRKL